MKIAGIQKLTLIDYPDKMACTLFLHGCNFRCGFCHNPELVVELCNEQLTETEVLSFLDKRRKYLDGVCITGGEPLMSLDKEFLKKIKEKGYLIKIDTNGSFPDRLKEVLDLFDYVAMDIKSSKDKYNWVSNSGVEVELIEESIKLIVESGLDYEFRTTLVEGIHNSDEVRKTGEWLNDLIGKKPKKYVLQGFKNFGKFIDEKYKEKPSMREDFVYKLKDIAEDFFEEVEVRV